MDIALLAHLSEGEKVPYLHTNRKSFDLTRLNQVCLYWKDKKEDTEKRTFPIIPEYNSVLSSSGDLWTFFYFDVLLS